MVKIKDSHADNVTARVGRFFRSLMLLLLLSSVVNATTTSSTDGWTPPNLTAGAPSGSYSLSGFDSVNLINGNLNFHLPLLRIGGRRDAQYTIQLPIEEHWRVLHNIWPDESEFWVPSDYTWYDQKPGYGPGILMGRAASNAPCGTYSIQTLTRLTFILPDGTEYELRDQLTGGAVQTSSCSTNGFDRGRIFVTADGSAATFVSDTTIYDQHGTVRTYPFGYLTLRNGLRYRIDWGRVSWMRDRNGNMLSFTYGQYGVTGLEEINRGVHERRVYRDGSNLQGKMAFSGGFVDQLDPSGTTLLSREKHYFYGETTVGYDAFTYLTWDAMKEYQTEEIDTANCTPSTCATVLKRVNYNWQQGCTVSPWSSSVANNPRVAEIDTSLLDTNQLTKQTFGYDCSNNKTDVYEYDFGSGAPGALVRRTHTDYITAANYTDALTGPHLRSLPTQVLVYDAANKLRAETGYEYDNYNQGSSDVFHSGLQDRTDISGIISRDGFANNNLGCTSSPQGYFPTTDYNRGNVTKTTRYLVDVNGNVTGSINGYLQYDIAGNVAKAIDPRSTATNIIATSYEFNDSFGLPNGEARSNSAPPGLCSQKSYALPTKMTIAGQTTYTQFDYYLAQMVDVEDPNGTVYSGYYNDALDRPTKVIRAANRDVSLQSQSIFSYDDVSHTITTTSDQNSFNELNPLKSLIIYDGLGRTVESRTYENSTKYIATQQSYDALGRAYRVSNPFRPLAPDNETAVWSTTAFDALGRVISVTTPDNAIATSSYSGNSVTATDQIGKKRKSVNDALGRLTQVYEDPNGVNWLSNYTYDVLDNLTSVSQYDPISQITQTRSFLYDSLKRLLSATNPENGVVNYIYDENGNPLVKTDALGVSTHLSYDALNRVVRRWYNGSNLTTAITNNLPALPSGVSASDEVSYWYDSQGLPNGAPSFTRTYSTGRLVAATYGSNSSAGDYYNFDALGRVVLKIQQTGGVNYQTSASYSVGGQLVSETYPSLRTVSYGYDQAGRTSSFSGNLGDGVNRTYSTGIIYSPVGGMSKEQFGTDTALFNKLWYNSRGQLSEIRESTSYTGPTDTSWNRGAIINHYSDQCWGMCTGQSMMDNNGTVKKQEHQVPDNEQVSSYQSFLQWYHYDNLNRLDNIHEGRFIGGQGSPSQDVYQIYNAYDRYGNRTIDPVQTSAVLNHTQFSVSAANNRLGVPNGQTGVMTYDNVGNLTTDSYTSTGSRTYDAQNRMTSAQGSPYWSYYTYDGEGRRIRRKIQNVETWQVYGMDGELLAEYAANAAATSPQKEYGYRNGQLLVTTDGPANEKVWVEDAVPAGATTAGDAEGWSWVSSNPSACTGSLASQSNIYSGYHQHYFYGATATLAVNAGDKLVAYIYIDPSNLPSEIVLQWNDGSTWNHRAYWGSNSITNLGWGAPGTNGLRYMGPMPAAGQWMRLEVPAGQVGLEGTTLRGLAFTMYGGRATWDRASKVVNGATGGTQWLVADQLGTPRIVFDQTGGFSSVKRHDYLPFGEELTAGINGRTTQQGYGANDAVRQKFTHFLLWSVTLKST